MKKITICGATGFIGINLVRKFSKKYKVYAIYNKKKPFSLKNVKWVKADLRNYKDCLKVTSLSKIIIQAAATTSGSKDIINNPFLHVTDNAIMNSYLLKASYVNSIEKFIFTSCTVMYHHSKKSLSENDVEESRIFKNYYGVGHTKLYVEKMCNFYSKISNIKFSIVRHSNIYGPYDKFSLTKGHFIGSSIKKAFLKKNFIQIFGAGNEKRDYLFIDDFLNFLEKLIIKQKNNFEIINCTYGKSFKIIDILKKIIKFSKTQKKIKKIKGKNINVDILVNSNKAKKLLDWKPNVSIDEGLKKTIKWYQNEIL
jgi:nucleoside-diphosphate-sugar epimerase